MSANPAKLPETSYRGNEIRLMDGAGNLIRIFTIEEFLKERPVDKVLQSKQMVISAKKRPEDRSTPYYRIETDVSDVLSDAREVKNRDRASRED